MFSFLLVGIKEIYFTNENVNKLIGIVHLLVCIISVRTHGDQLQNSWNRHSKKSKKHTNKPQLQIERICFGKRTQELDNYYLKEHSASENCYKYIVLQYAFEDIYLFHVSGVDLVENLKIKFCVSPSCNNSGFTFLRHWIWLLVSI